MDKINNKTCEFKYAISVVIPVFNAGDFINETLDSIISQDFNDYEILLIDDCSTDDSKQKISRYLSDNIHYFCQEKNTGGPSTPRNTGIKQSSGKYILLFDSDDLMLPGKLTKTYQILEANKNIGLLCTNFQSIDPQSKIIKPDFLKEYQSFRPTLQSLDNNSYKLNSSHAYSALLKANFIGTSSVAIPKKVLDDVGGFSETLTNADDVDMWLRVTRRFDILYLDQILHQYRIQPNSISFRGGKKNSFNRIHVLEKQLELHQSKKNIKSIHYRMAIHYSEAGVNDLKNGRRNDSRVYFAKSLRYHIKTSTIKYLLASILGDRLIQILTRLVHFFRKTK